MGNGRHSRMLYSSPKAFDRCECRLQKAEGPVRLKDLSHCGRASVCYIRARLSMSIWKIYYPPPCPSNREQKEVETNFKKNKKNLSGHTKQKTVGVVGSPHLVGQNGWGLEVAGCFTMEAGGCREKNFFNGLYRYSPQFLWKVVLPWILCIQFK